MKRVRQQVNQVLHQVAVVLHQLQRRHQVVSQAQQENNAGQENTQTDQGQGATGTEEYTTVQAGEGPEQVAARTGISVETLYQLNGIDPNNYMLYPGDTLRIK